MSADWWAGALAGLITGGVLVLLCFAALMVLVFHLAKPHAAMEGRQHTGDLGLLDDDPADEADQFLRDINRQGHGS